MKEYDKDKYRDIINMPHHISKKHSQMSMRDRAAQFAPFAALSGHKELLDKTAEEDIKKKS